jgi:hypothetical protein
MDGKLMKMEGWQNKLAMGDDFPYRPGGEEKKLIRFPVRCKTSLGAHLNLALMHHATRFKF